MTEHRPTSHDLHQNAETTRPSSIFPFINQAIDAICYIDLVEFHFYANDRLHQLYPALESTAFPTHTALADYIQSALLRSGCSSEQATSFWDLTCSTSADDGEQTLPIDGRAITLSFHFVHPRSGVFIVWRDMTNEVTEKEQHDAFLTGFSREVQHPITLISSYTERLSRNCDLDPVSKDLLHVVRREAERLEHLLTSFLAYQQQARHDDLTVTTFLLDPILQKMCAHYKTISPFHEIALSIAEPLVIKADEQRLLQLLHNLIGNAIRHSPEGGTIRLGLTRVEGTAVLSVHNPGLGIPPHLLPHLLDSRGSDDFDLGLLFCKQIVEAHGWSIHVESVYGEGTTCFIELHTLDVEAMHEK